MNLIISDLKSFKVTHYLTYCWTFVHITWWFLWNLFWMFNWLVRLLTFERVRINWWINRIYIVISFIWTHHIIEWRKLLWFFVLTWRYIGRLVILRTLIKMRNSLVRIYLIINWILISKTTLVVSKSSLIATKTTLITTESTLISSKTLITTKPLVTTKSLISSKIALISSKATLVSSKALISKISSKSLISLASLTTLTTLTKVIISRLISSF